MNGISLEGKSVVEARGPYEACVGDLEDPFIPVGLVDCLIDGIVGTRSILSGYRLLYVVALGCAYDLPSLVHKCQVVRIEFGPTAMPRNRNGVPKR